MKEILQKKQEVDDEDSVEQYILLSSIISEEAANSAEPIDFTKDFHLIVNRTRIDFNNKSCQLVTFKDVSVHQRLKHQEEKDKLLKVMSSHICDKVIDPLDSVIFNLKKLNEELQSKAD